LLTKELINVCWQKIHKEINMSWNLLAKQYNYKNGNGEALRQDFKVYRRKNGYFDKSKEEQIQDTPNYNESNGKNKDGSFFSDKLVEMNEKQSKDDNYILNAHGFDINEWELVSCKNNIWNVYSKQDGKIIMYSSKINVKPIKEFIWTEEKALKIFNSLKSEYKNKINIKPLQYKINNDLLVINISDLHYGLLSDMYSNGNDYNLDIAEKLYYDTLNDILNRLKYRKFEKILFCIGNDFINFDNLTGGTTKGTPQDNSDLWFTVVQRATQLIVNGIDMILKIAPIDVVLIPSNHDLHTTFGITQSIKHHYLNNINVYVDSSPLFRKYYKFGKTLLCLSHDLKFKEALKIITSEAKDKWTDSKHIICILAHLHQGMIYEKQGYLEIMRTPTISGWSRWSNSKGYIQSERKNQTFIINKEKGITDIVNTVFDY